MTERQDMGGQFWHLPSEAWYGGAGVHLAVAGGARPWVCRYPGKTAVVVLADLRQMESFAEDWKALGQGEKEDELFVLRELPLALESASNKAYWMQRGETLRRWQHRGGFLVATPGALLGPCAEGADTLSLQEGDHVGWAHLLSGLDEGGYVRSDLVWAPGQWVSRGGDRGCFRSGGTTSAADRILRRRSGEYSLFLSGKSAKRGTPERGGAPAPLLSEGRSRGGRRKKTSRRGSGDFF